MLQYPVYKMKTIHKKQKKQLNFMSELDLLGFDYKAKMILLVV